ncbi:hypothetical protein [Leeia oryzae]|uniref:hypothetical protein n=1 Tax=Leeia oryzae TaxID=356662 RepID=UPI0012E9B679|nr:hypothetical protein [Leeia oryzae]
MKQKIVTSSLFVGGASFLLLSSASTVTATPLCTGLTTSQSVSVTDSALYITQAFTMRCSPNVVMDYSENLHQVAVCAASNKGGAKYGGVTNGHSIVSQGTWSSGDVMTSDVANGC